MMLIAAAIVFTADAKIVRGYNCQTESGDVSLKIDSIDFRSDLARVYGTLIGKPHTSFRIDKMMLSGLMSPKGVHWTDAEGIDMNRWFQWEDNGKIAVEIDFPPLREASTAVITISGPKGKAVWNVSKIAAKKQCSNRKAETNKRHRKR